MNKYLMVERDGIFNYLATETKADRHVCCYKVERINTWEVDGKPLEMDSFFEIDIKWDGCSNVMFEQGWLHFCGINQVRDIPDLMAGLYHTAWKRFVASDPECYAATEWDEFLTEEPK